MTLGVIKGYATRPETMTVALVFVELVQGLGLPKFASSEIVKQTIEEINDEVMNDLEVVDWDAKAEEYPPVLKDMFWEKFVNNARHYVNNNTDLSDRRRELFESNVTKLKLKMNESS